MSIFFFKHIYQTYFVFFFFFFVFFLIKQPTFIVFLILQFDETQAQIRRADAMETRFWEAREYLSLSLSLSLYIYIYIYIYTYISLSLYIYIYIYISII